MELIEELYEKWQKRRAFKKEMKRLDNFKPKKQQKKMTKNYNRTTAALLALFLGGLGIHKFYLGKSGIGWLYLLFCWSFVPAIVSFFEAISFFTMTDDSFDEKYNTADVQLSIEQELHDAQKNNISYKIKKLQLDEDYSAAKMSAEMYQLRLEQINIESGFKNGETVSDYVSPSEETMQQLKIAKHKLDLGILTKEEYQIEKQKLLIYIK